MTLQCVQHGGFSFYVDDSLFKEDSFNHWLDLIVFSINRVTKSLEGIVTKTTISQWVVFHRKYDKNHPLDFNYAKFSSLNISFEVIRDSNEFGYSPPKIINLCVSE